MKSTIELNSSNADRAQRARNALDAYINETDDADNALVDLLTDLMHRSAIDCEAPNFDDSLNTARMHFETETDEEAAAGIDEIAAATHAGQA